MTKLTFSAVAPLMLAFQLGAQSPVSVPQSSTVQSQTETAEQAAFNYAGPLREIARKSLLGSKLCGAHVADEQTAVDNLAISANFKHQAVAVSWFDPATGIQPHNAIVRSDGQCFASEGMILDGRQITRILAISLTVTNLDVAVFEAIYTTGTQTITEHRGVFAGDHFLLELDPKKAWAPDSWLGTYETTDFSWDDEHNRIIPREGVALIPVTYPAPATALPTQPAPAVLPVPAAQPFPQSTAPKSLCDALKATSQSKAPWLAKIIQDRINKLKAQYPGGCPQTGAQQK